NCLTPFPENTSVHFYFSVNCSSNVESHSLVIDNDHQEASVCFSRTGWTDPSCAIILDSMVCATNSCCPSPLNQKVNPYYTGLKGNWRNKNAYVYTVDRDPKIESGNGAQLPTNLRKGGVFSAFTSFYKVDNGKFVIHDPHLGDPAYTPVDKKWIASATVTKVNNKGQEVENKNALNKYSSAQFGFNDLVTTAVGSNARDNEIGYDGFEDYLYNTSCGNSAAPCNEDGHFNFKKQLGVANGSGFVLTNSTAHTGNYSVSVSPSEGSSIAFTNRKVVTSLDDPPQKYDFNSQHEMVLKEGGLLSDFRPVTGKKYVVSGWIKGDVAPESDADNTAKAKIIVQGRSGSTVMYTAIAVKAGPKVEGWTRVMTTFELPTDQSIDNISILLSPGSSTSYFDDIRIHPYDGNMKSFAYDYRTSRLMAILDENNYATFFEYDDEGQLLRNKKETEKGIVTLKETRSRIRKNN
ncbi:MAG TPA: hypothetical protein VKH37_03510, partial [Ferruginibacter sp.]|nr:hypothetical protein [Ferruginibacter sp.]